MGWNIFFLFKGNSFRRWSMSAIMSLYLYFLILEAFKKYKNTLKALLVILKKKIKGDYL